MRIPLTTTGCTVSIALTLFVLAGAAAVAEPGTARTDQQVPSLPETPRGDAIVAPVKRMAPQMPANVAQPEEKPVTHKRKPKKARH